MTDGFVLWELISDYAYAILTVIGAVIVLGFVYRRRQKADGYYNRERRK